MNSPFIYPQYSLVQTKKSMDLNLSPAKNSDLNYYKNLKEKYTELKLASKTNTKSSGSSIDRIAEFRKKLESSFALRNEQNPQVVEEESPSAWPKLSFDFQKPAIPRPNASERLSKNTSLSSIAIVNKPKIEEVLPISTLIEARKALANASDKNVQDLPYLYSYTLNELRKAFDKRVQGS